MERKYYKAINFDLSTAKLKEVYSKNNYRKAYKDLTNYFEANGFSHRQYSGYLSNEKMSTSDIIDLVEDLVKKYNWIKKCTNHMDVTNVGRGYDLIAIINKENGKEEKLKEYVLKSKTKVIGRESLESKKRKVAEERKKLKETSNNSVKRRAEKNLDR